ncbi:MAG: Ig-like domain-containing protein [bacterium]
MHKVSRSLLLAGVLAFGTLTAACGDKVNIVQPPNATGVQSVVVSPPSATIQIGAANAIQLAVSVTADASTAKTVTWTTSSAAVATVSATGLVTGVAAGTVTITATSTADASKASASAITVGSGGTTVNTVAISSVTQGGLNIPVNLAATAGQIDVTLFVSGPGGTLNLIQNCSATPTTATGDVIVAQQQVAGSQNQSPVTLSYNTAATGTVTGGVAVPSATSTTPLYLNGPCVIKASLGTAVATNVTPITLANVSFYRATVAWSGTPAISSINNLLYQNGDGNVTITPINYVSAAPLAFISGTFAGRPFTNLTPAAGTQTFTVNFPSAVVAQGTTVPATSISQYTSASTGDFLFVTASVTAGGQPGFTTVASSFGPFRVDNQAPAAPTNAVINTTTNFLNASYAFAPSAATYVSGTDAGVDSDVIVFGAAASTVAGLTGNTNYGVPAGQGVGATQCSQTGWTTVTSGNDLANSLAGISNQYRVRVFETDKLGNIRCADLTSPAGLGNTTGFFGIDKQAPTLAQTGGPASGSVIVTGTQNSFAFQDSISGFVLNHQVQYSLYRGFTASTANCVAINDGINAPTTGTTATLCAVTANNGPNVVLDGNSGTQGYYNLTAKSVDQAGNASPTLAFVYLLDNTAPVVQGISIPQNLVGGAPVTFSSTATDNVDLASTNFNITYSAATAGANLFYAGQTYGTKFTAAGVVTTTPVAATVPFFIQQLQATTAGGTPVALTAADSGEAQVVNVRAVDAAKNVSALSSANIPNINISSAAGFLGTTDFTTFQEVNTAGAISNPANPAAGGVATLSATAVLNAAGAQNAVVPFSQVCFFYQQSAAGAAADPTIPLGSYVQVGCVSAPSLTDVAGISRTWTYQLTGFNPPAALGTAGAINIVAVGIKGTGVGILSQVNSTLTLAP